MAVKLVATIKRWQGLSADVKPSTDIPVGSTFDELDTGKKFKWIGYTWIEDLSEVLTIGKAIEINNETRQIAEQILLEVQAANIANGIEVI